MIPVRRILPHRVQARFQHADTRPDGSFSGVLPYEDTQDYADVPSALLDTFQKPRGIIVVMEDDTVLEHEVLALGAQAVAARGEGVLATLERLYAERKTPLGIVFDHGCRAAGPFLHEIYLRPQHHMYRTLPVAIINYQTDTPQRIRIVAVNGSPRTNGDTKRMLEEEIKRYWTNAYTDVRKADLEHITECLACGGHQKKCRPGCVIDDQMTELLPLVKDCDALLIGSPVYMDLPTSRIVAFLSRLTLETKHNRRAYIGKHAYAFATGYCSGTKAVIGAINNALEMMGFDIPGRSSREYIELWKDGKTRGGVPDEWSWPE